MRPNIGHITQMIDFDLLSAEEKKIILQAALNAKELPQEAQEKLILVCHSKDGFIFAAEYVNHETGEGHRFFPDCVSCQADARSKSDTSKNVKYPPIP